MKLILIIFTLILPDSTFANRSEIQNSWLVKLVSIQEINKKDYRHCIKHHKRKRISNKPVCAKSQARVFFSKLKKGDQVYRYEVPEGSRSAMLIVSKRNGTYKESQAGYALVRNGVILETISTEDLLLIVST